MSQCVPTWDVDDTPTTGHRSPAASSAAAAAADIPILDYEVAELTWENGQVALHGLGPPRAQAKYGSGGTLESIVNQATRQPLGMAMDALVPEPSPPVGVASCSAPRVSGSTALDSTFDMSFTSTSFDNTKTTTTLDSREIGDEVVKSKAAGKSSVSTKRSRAAAIHNQSERKRRDKINQRMKTLQKLVPNSSKTDKASMLDEVIEYLKQLQGQVSMMSRMNMPSMMMPMAMQQQLQMSMMTNPMGLGMGMGMGLGHVMDISSMNRAAATNMMMPNPFMPMAPPSSNDGRFQSPVIPDPMAAFLSSQSQPTSMDAYSRMAALYQQMQQQLSPPSNPK